MIALGVMLALAGIIVLIAGAAQALHNRTYASCTETVTGKVIRKHSRKLKNGTSYELTVSYTVDGTAYEKVVGALLTEYQSIHEGDETELRYKPADPRKAVRPMDLNPRNVRIPLLIGAVLIASGVALFITDILVTI